MKAKLLSVLAALLAAPVLSSPVLADCPTKADLSKGGISFAVSPTGAKELHRAGRGGLIEVTIRFKDGGGNEMSYAHGVYPVSRRDLSGGSGPGDIFALPNQYKNWPAPKPGTRVTLPSEMGDVNVRSGAMKSIKWGACSYKMFEVAQTFVDEPGLVETYQYLPELGIGLAAKYRSGGKTDVYRYSLVMK